MQQQKKFWQSPNFWNSIISIFASLFVGSTASVVAENATSIVNAVFAEQIMWTAIINGGLTILNSVYQLFIKKKAPTVLETAAEQVLKNKASQQ